MPRLSDSRTVTLADAEQMLETIAHATVRTVKIEAATKLKIAKLQTELEHQTAVDRKIVEAQGALLCAFIESHPEQFAKPRKHRTDFGTFGMHKVSDLHITDREALVQKLLGNGYPECLRTTHSPVKAAIKARLLDGEDFPGCALRVGHIARYDVAKHLLVDPDDNATA